MMAECVIHTLVFKDPDDPESVDIVAVHGLNGHWEASWADQDTGTNWLRESISREIPTARIMSFAYKSSLHLDTAVVDVFDLAEQLLTSLRNCRVSETEQERPIVFICHSLGGIVFKQVRTVSWEKYRVWIVRPGQ